MFKANKKLALAAAISGALIAPSAMATNGMNLEGYGAIATGMGGASMAYNNGAAAVMNNPATLGLAEEDGSQIDVAIGILAPTIESSMEMPMSMTAESGANQFLMPAIGWGKKSGKMAYGFGMFSQGGMGTEYEANTFMAAGSGEEVRSEVGVGRLIAPLAYNIDDKFTVGGSVDFVWAGMDLKMAMPGGWNTPGVPNAAPGTFMDFMPGSPNVLGVASGTMTTIMGGALMAGMLDTINWARFDFSDDSDFTGEAKSTGFGAKLGATYRINNQFTLGAAYHSKTSLGDLETDNAVLSMNVSGPATGGNAVTVPVTGKIAVEDFQWPEMYALGGSYKINDKFMMAMDYKLIKWSGVMENFNMSFTADATQTGAAAMFGLGGSDLSVTMYQDWEDQSVIQMGGQYQAMPNLAVRAGVNVSSNPVPDEYMNPMFPAIIEKHFTLGMGYGISKESSIDLSLVIAPEVEQTNSNTGVTTTHSQQNWNLLYSYRF